MKENRWIGALIGRCVSYGLIVGFFFFGLSVLLLMLFAVLWGVVNSVTASPGFLYGPLGGYRTAIVSFGPATVFTLGIVTVEATVIGFLGGAVAGFHSPPREVGSAYLDTVLQSGGIGLGLGVLSGLVCGLMLAVPLGGIVGFGVIVCLAFIGHVAGLWRGINRAIWGVRQQQEQHG